MKDLSDSSLPRKEEVPAFLHEKQLPKQYNEALERVTQALEERQPTTNLEKVVFGGALALCFILFLPLLLDWLSYPYWLELFYDLSIFVEASLPLVVSFFLKNKHQATILRIAGTIVLFMYVLTYF